ncbi:6-hydroxy-3-succinoylpyridine 3-monooxygenase HspA [Paracoccus haematequi]|uniref:6-hydroxy-3-succinoylpyridine 3-monooxygenase HspA n=1 Tax=Paracoccus haematequi TaxID=2491866 RepID=A0A3S4DA85_9RHOB|nr:NYN domain-containing protein [Paracoccus haematequi]VDS07906.1 6-hydroxy-3-succinoylpyridine 3-monooxygenase HspA [Paracoccus haematequi]
MPKRTIVYVDGFNLYHALDELRDDSLKWLCLRRLSESFLRHDEELKQVKYFSAYATWMPDAHARHRDYVQALMAEGVKFVEGNFKKKSLKCRTCSSQYWTHEEKETDVNIAIHLVRDTLQDSYDRAIIISADTDMCSAIDMARQLSGTKQVDVIAPPGRFARSRSLKPLLEIQKGRLKKCRLNETYDLGKGKTVSAPVKYRLPFQP